MANNAESIPQDSLDLYRNLRQANLQGANLANANFAEADLTGADLTEVDLIEDESFVCFIVDFSDSNVPPGPLPRTFRT